MTRALPHLGIRESSTSLPQVTPFPPVTNLLHLAEKSLLPLQNWRVFWYEASWRDHRRSFCLTKHTPTIYRLERHGQNGCTRIPCILLEEGKQVRFSLPGQRILPQFSRNEDSGHQDNILCGNLLSNKDGFIHFGGYHHFCRSLTAHAIGHIHMQHNYQVEGAREGDPKS